MKCKNSYVFILLVCVFFVLQATAQQRPQPACPTVRTSCPDTVDGGATLTFTVNVSGGDPNVTPTYNWTVSAGSIASGQGTSTIEVETKEVVPEATITATVDVGGFDRSCSTSSSCTTSVLKKPASRKLDEYANLKAADENTRLDNFVIELQNDPTAQAYLIAYLGRKSRPDDGRKALNKAKDYLTKSRGLAADRLVVIEGGYREQPTMELWLVPSGAPRPQATPTLRPDEVKPAKPVKPKSVKSGKKS